MPRSLFSWLTVRRPSPPVGEAAKVAPLSADLVDPRVMDQIGNLELLSRCVVDGFLAGKHRSTHKGGCCEFAQHRPYSQGDEIRLLDWRVYARNDRYFVRQFVEETNLQALIALDTSGSMAFQGSTVSKLDYARGAAACLARLLLHQRDAVGCAVLEGEAPKVVPPRQNASHLLPLLFAFENAKAVGVGNLPEQIRACIPRLRRRGMFILFSDCFGDLEELSTALRVVRARGHDVLVFQVLAPEEIHFNFRRWSSFHSLEHAGHKLNLDPAAVRDEYLRRLSEFLQGLEEAVTGVGGDYVRMTTHQDLGDVLGYFLGRRAVQGRRGRFASGRMVSL